MTTSPYIIELVRRTEAEHGVELIDADGTLMIHPPGRVDDETLLVLAQNKQAVLSYLRSIPNVDEALNAITDEQLREELRTSFDEIVAERIIVQGNARHEAVRIAWDEIGQQVERAIERMHKSGDGDNTPAGDSASKGIGYVNGDCNSEIEIGGGTA